MGKMMSGCVIVSWFGPGSVNVRDYCWGEGGHHWKTVAAAAAEPTLRNCR